MGTEQALTHDLFQEIISYMRDNHAEAIDKAYEFFWDEHTPDEFLSPKAYEIGFHNFEDWFVFDSRLEQDKESVMDLYIRTHPDIGEVRQEMLAKLKNSTLSLYEVSSVDTDERVLLKDLLLGGEVSLCEKALTQSLNTGDLFAARLLTLDGKTVMSGSVYPFPKEQKKRALSMIDRQFNRYRKNVKPDGTMIEYLKQYGDVFNLVWISLIIDAGADTD